MYYSQYYRSVFNILSILTIISLVQNVGNSPTTTSSKPSVEDQLIATAPIITSSPRIPVKNDGNSNLSCGYSSCPKTDPNKINVHVVAHTHDDVGWLKTVDQYYYGTRKRFSPIGVQHILDSVIPQLVMDKKRRFIYVEMSFFFKWWSEQNDNMKKVVRNLVNEGRLEFINGGWCMNDEATVNYHSTIEQMTLGLKFLNQTFGQCAHPKVGWQIDPFGHTNEQASLFAQFGFDGMFFTRISYLDKYERIENKSLDIIWHGDRALAGESGAIFTNIFRDGYDSPSTFCYDIFCNDDELVDNEKSYEYNINNRVEEFIEIINLQSKARLTNHVLIPFGGDFHFSAAGVNFKNIDKLIKYVNQRSFNINMFYSTPSCYQYSVYQYIKSHEIELPAKLNDFMPYDSSRTVWWSGYFTSRPSIKLIATELATLLQVSRIVSLDALLNLRMNSSFNKLAIEHESRCLEGLWQVLGDLQHHDAVTGTEKQHVCSDYVRRSSDAMKSCSKFIGDIRRSEIFSISARSKQLLKQNEKLSRFPRFHLDPIFLQDTSLCPLNISQCDALESNVDVETYLETVYNPEGILYRPADRFEVPTAKDLGTKSVLIHIYNPLAKPIIQHDVRLPCNGACELDRVRLIHVASNETIKLVRLPVPAGIAKLPFRDSLTNYEILFYANLPPLGYTSFIIEDNNNDENINEENDLSDSIVIESDKLFEQQQPQKHQKVRSRKVREKENLKNDDHLKQQQSFEYLTIDSGIAPGVRRRRDSNSLQQNSGDRVIVKFDMNTGMIVGLKRVSDGSELQISQKFGYYLPSLYGRNNSPGAYIFRPNTSEPYLFDKPMNFKMYKRKNGALIEIHQKWTSWLYQTIRVDAKKNYIEFDYVVGPIPIIQRGNLGREIVTRYITNMKNNGVFLTDSNARQLLVRHRLRDTEPEQLGGSFYPVVSTMVLKNDASNSSSNGGKHCDKCPAETVAILVDRAQGGTSLNEGQMELLIHRRHTRDDQFGVDEALDEPGEDGRGLVTRGKHRLYLKFFDHDSQHETAQTKFTKNQIYNIPDKPSVNLSYERNFYNMNTTFNKKVLEADPPTCIINDQVINDLKQESVKFALRPVLTFDRLILEANEFLEMISKERGNPTTRLPGDYSLLNSSLPGNVHLLTLQPWTEFGSNVDNQFLIRLENLDNPLTLHPYPDFHAYLSLYNSYKPYSQEFLPTHESRRNCEDKYGSLVEVDLKYLISGFELIVLNELNLGANARLQDDHRLDWTNELNCESYLSGTSIKLRPRQIRTFLASAIKI